MSVIAVRQSLLTRNLDERETWDKHIEYLLSLMGYCVGFGNVWRFPYLAYNNGGAAFLFPYIILTILIGIPIIFLECALGQFLSLGPVAAFGMIPVCRGVGACMVVLATYFSLYYIMYMVYVTKYFYYSFSTKLPWMECSSSWGADERCFLRGRDQLMPTCENVTDCSKNDQCGNATLQSLYNCTKYKQESATSQFWNINILHRTRDSNIEHLGLFCVDLCLLLLLNWAIVCLCLVRGIKSSGKVVYFTALFPYVVLLIMGAIGCTLDGAWTGLKFLFVPTESNIMNVFKMEVWKRALEQLLFSLGLGIGGIIMLSSYSRLDNRVLRDALIISMLDLATSVLACITIFATLGFLAFELEIPVARVIREGPGLMFVVIPEAIGLLPIPQIWSLLFFLMVYTLGLDSEFVMLEILLTTLKDEVAIFRRHKVMTTVIACLCCFLLGLPFCFEGGYHLVDLYDTYAVNVGLMGSVFSTLIVVCYFYGLQRFSEDIQFMLGFHPKWYYWKACWALLDPIILMILLASGVWSMNNWGYDHKEYSQPIRYVKWYFAWSPCSMMPIFALGVLIYYKKSTGKFITAFLIPPQWGPRDPLTNNLYQEWLKQRTIHNKMKPPNLARRCLNSLKCWHGRKEVAEVMSGESFETIHVENIK